MASVEQDLASFAEFARDELRAASTPLSIDELFDRWRVQNPPSEDALAIKASLDDMQAGEAGRPFDQFAAEFRKRLQDL